MIILKSNDNIEPKTPRLRNNDVTNYTIYEVHCYLADNIDLILHMNIICDDRWDKVENSVGNIFISLHTSLN